MEPAPALTKPTHLRQRSPFAIAAFVVGLAAFAIVCITQREMWSTPDWRISVPGFVVTACVAGIAIARREKAYALWITGLGLAAASLVLGWFLMVAIVAAVAAILMLILHTVM